MDKSELKDIIKKLAGDILNGKSDEKSTPEDELPISTKYNRFDLLVKFPVMIPVMENLLTNDFELFVKDIFWVAPKPTTFKIVLINDQHFFLLYDPRSWTAQVEGKKYYLLELRDAELASEAISRILRYGVVENKPAEEKPEKTTSPTSSNDEETPTEPETPEETPEA